MNGVSSSLPIINGIGIMAHNRISKNPIGINRMVKIIVSSRIIIPRYLPHNRFFTIPTAERDLIVVKLRNKWE